ncbi:hypothetical protein ACHAWU_002837 [Discostella pseudostelligera]|uniref:Amino acid transporter transmembrane domain-containing protein n=1 Tax=Discostella pseudostelligera TaxID=259834 RepID=A0ABD3M2L2_9STRA
MAGSVRQRDSVMHPTSPSNEHSDISHRSCPESSTVNSDDAAADDDSHHHQHHHRSTNWWENFQPGSISNLCSATLGAGALSLPYAISLTGIVIGVVLLMISAYLTIISVDVIIGWTTCGESTGGVSIDLLLWAVAYIVAVGDILNEGVQAIGIDSDHGEISRQRIMISFWVLVMFPLSLQRNVRALERFSSLGVLSIISLVIAAVIHSLIHSSSFGGDGGTQQIYRTDVNSMLWPNSFWDIIKACPIIIFAFSCQINVCAIYEELTPIDTPCGTSSHAMPMLKSKQVAMHRITTNSVILCMILYICIGLFGFLDFGHDTADNILNNYCMQYTHDLMIIVPSAFFAVAIVIAFPFNILPARVTLKLILDRFRKRRRCDRCHRFFSSITCDNCLWPWTGPVEYSRVGSIELDDHSIASDPLLGDDRFGDRPILIPHMSLDAASLVTDNECSPESPPVEHFLLTLLLSGSALIVALLIPGISTVFGIMGGTAASVIAFILPGMFLKEATGPIVPRQVGVRPLRVLPLLFTVGGTLSGIMSTGVTIYGLFIPSDGAGVSICGNHTARTE